jgi:dihydroflavonol-4-reductase
VVALARTHDDELATWPGVRFMVASVEDYDALLAALRAASRLSGIFHLAGLVEHSRRRPEAMYRVHVAGTVNVLRVAHELVRRRRCAVRLPRRLTRACVGWLQGIKRVVYASTSGTVACSHTFAPIGDDAPYASALVRTWPYYDSKIVAEQEAAAFVARHPGLELITLRPTLVLGPGDDRRSSVTLIDEFLHGRIPLVPSGGLSYLDVRDAATAFRAAMHKVSGCPMGGVAHGGAAHMRPMRLVTGRAGPVVLAGRG